MITWTKLVRWGVTDWTSCFMASRFYMGEDPERYCSSRQTKLAVRNMGLDPKGDPGVKRSKKTRSERKCRRERKLTNASSQTKDEVENGAEALNYQPFSEEDYIVFCFREDGAFDVVKDGKPETPNFFYFVSSSPRLVYRKLNYGEEAKAVKSCSIEDMLNGHEFEICPPNQEEIVIPHHQNENEEEEKDEIEEQDDHWSNSSRSNRSSGSFAFPVLGWEWSGSPVKMPKPGQQLRKHQALLRVGFHCCRF